MNILAGDRIDLRWDMGTREYRPAADVPEGPVFTIQVLNFWQAQGVVDSSLPVLDRFRDALRDGLVAIDGDPAMAAAFIERPRALLVNGLFDAIVGAASGN